MGTKKSEHQSSLLLSQEANDKIFSLLEPKTHALSTALVGVVISKPPKHPDWKHLRNGIAMLTKDYTRKAYFVQIYDIVDWERLREEELKKGTAYHASMPKFHQFEAGKGQTMGLKFASEDEARRFAQVARAIVMTGQYKTDGCPVLPETKDGNEMSPAPQEKSNDGETKPEKDRSSQLSPPPPAENRSSLLPPAPAGNRSSLLPPPPPPPVSREVSPSSSPTPVAEVASQVTVSTNKQSLPQRPHSMPLAATSAQSNHAEPNSTDRKRPKSKRLTKDMIGEPKDFKHVYHFGFNSAQPLDEKALRTAAGARPPAPSRPPPPPPPLKNSNIGKPTATDEVSDRSISSSVASPAGTKEQDDSFSTLSTNVATPTDADSFASDLIEEYLRRSNLTSDEQDAADAVSPLSAKDQDLTEETKNPVSETDIHTENDMSQKQFRDKESESVDIPDTTSMGLQTTPADDSSHIISNEEAAEDPLLQNGALNDNIANDEDESVDIQSDNTIIESSETSIENNSEIINNKEVSGQFVESTTLEQSHEESSNEHQNDEDVECTSQESRDAKQSDNNGCLIQDESVDIQSDNTRIESSETSVENNSEIINNKEVSEQFVESTTLEQSHEESSNEHQNDEDVECTSQEITNVKQSDNNGCLLQEPTVAQQQDAELTVACSEGNHPNEPIQSDIPKAPARYRKKQPKRHITPPPTPPPTPEEVESSTIA